MRIDPKRVKNYLYDIQRNALDLENLLKEYPDEAIRQNPIIMKAVKYTLIELAEAMANVLQHLLAKGVGKPVSGYLDTLLKAKENGIVSEELFSRLKPFFEFRNSLIHRYWIMDDAMILTNLHSGHPDFHDFIEQIERWMSGKVE